MVLSNFNKRKRRVRYAVKKAAIGRPVLSLFRSNANIYVQVIDHVLGRTIVSASTLDKEVKAMLKAVSASSIAAAKIVGEVLARRALDHNITKVAFDRGGYAYHGRIAALADAARKAGLDF